MNRKSIYLKTIILVMLAFQAAAQDSIQVGRFFSEEAQPEMITATGGIQQMTIEVSELPSGATLQKATLMWEGQVSNTSGNDNSINSLQFAIRKEGDFSSAGVNLPQLTLSPGQKTGLLYRLPVADVTSLISGNGTYTVKLSGEGNHAGLQLQGHWVMRIEYSQP